MSTTTDVDPRREIRVGGDESGGLDFSGHADGRYFLIVTVGSEGDALPRALAALATDLRAITGDPSVGQPFHASKDVRYIRERLFDVLAAHDVAIDASIVDKRAVPADLVGGRNTPGKHFFSLVWYHHLIHALPGLLSPACKVHLTIAELGAYSRKTALQTAVKQATGVAYAPLLIDAIEAAGVGWSEEALRRVPALMFSYADAKDEPLLQIADYCGWAIQRKLERDDDAAYAKIKHLIRSERYLTIKIKVAANKPVAAQAIGLGTWTGLEGGVHDYEAVSEYRVGPADSFQALLALQEALRLEDLPRAIACLELIQPAALFRTEERVRGLLHFVGALTDQVLPDPELALRVTTILARVARHVARADADDLLGRALLSTALYNQALTLGRLGRDVDALRVYDDLIAEFHDAHVPVIDAQVAKAVVNRAHALRRRGDDRAAFDAYCQVIARYVDSTETLFDEPIIKALGGVADLGAIDARRAEETYRRAISSAHPQAAPRATNSLGLLLKERGDRAGAEELFRRAVASGHRAIAPWAAHNLGWLLREQDRGIEAEEAYRRAITFDDPHIGPKAALSLGWLRLARGEYAGAEASLRDVITSGHSDAAPEAMLHLAQILVLTGRDEEAGNAVRQAIATGHPLVAPRAEMSLGWLLQQGGDNSAAVAAYRRAIDSRQPDVVAMATRSLEQLAAES